MLSINRYVIALLLIAFGAALLVDQLDYFSLEWGELFATYWPAIFILSGLDMCVRGLIGLFQKNSKYTFSSFIWGLFWIAVGAAIIANNLGYISFSWGDFFIALIGIGLILIGINVMFFKPKVTIHVEKKSSTVLDSDEDEENDEDDDEDEDDDITDKFEGPIDPKVMKHFETMKQHEKHMKQHIKELERHKRELQKEIHKDPKFRFAGVKVPMPGDHSKRAGLVGDIKMGASPWEVNDMEMSHGIGKIDIDFARASFPEREVTMVITSWAGEIELALPQDLPVSIISSVNAGSMKILGNEIDGMKREFVHVTEGYDEAVTKLKIVIRLGAGNVEINRHV